MYEHVVLKIKQNDGSKAQLFKCFKKENAHELQMSFIEKNKLCKCYRRAS